MRNFFTLTQIYNNEKLNREVFIDNFCNKMAEEGIELNREGYTEEKYEKRLKRREIVCSELIAGIKEIREHSELYNEYKAYEEAVKDKNLKILQKYGII